MHESADGVEVKQNFCSDNLCNVMDPDGNGAAAITGKTIGSDPVHPYPDLFF